MRFFSWREMAQMDNTSVSTQKRLQANDPRYPRKIQLSPGRVGFAEDDRERYDLQRMADAAV